MTDDLRGVDDAIAERAFARRLGPRRRSVPYSQIITSPEPVSEARLAWERKVAVWEHEDRLRPYYWPEDGPVMRLLLELADQVARLVACLVRLHRFIEQLLRAVNLNHEGGTT